MILSDEFLAELARTVAETCEEEIDCEQMLERAAEFITAVSRRQQDLADSLRVVAQHLRICAECREEIELILKTRYEGGD